MRRKWERGQAAAGDDSGSYAVNRHLGTALAAPGSSSWLTDCLRRHLPAGFAPDPVPFRQALEGRLADTRKPQGKRHALTAPVSVDAASRGSLFVSATGPTETPPLRPPAALATEGRGWPGGGGAGGGGLRRSPPPGDRPGGARSGVGASRNPPPPPPRPPPTPATS